MQLPSLQKLANTALSVIKRFPFEILSACITVNHPSLG